MSVKEGRFHRNDTNTQSHRLSLSSKYFVAFNSFTTIITTLPLNFGKGGITQRAQAYLISLEGDRTFLFNLKLHLIIEFNKNTKK